MGIKEIKKIIAIGSGKGGVGKSTVAVNLALALSQQGAKVGILDADIYGPSLPTLLGTVGQKPTVTNKTLQPIERYGLQSMSMGYLIDPDIAMVWRGPMIGKALEQLLNDTAWNALDYLVIDLPPGTGDIQLTLCQKMPISGVIIVTTPQNIALSDVKRACDAFQKLNVPILGFVENMSHYHCTQCGNEEKLFGEGGGLNLAETYNAPLLGSIPLNINIQKTTDSGKPYLSSTINTTEATIFLNIAQQINTLLSLQPKNYAAKFPKIVIEPRTK